MPLFKPIVSLLTSSVMLTGCASAPVATTPGAVNVVYFMRYPDGSYLKERPTEITIVKRETTQKQVAVQVALNVFMLAMGGGVGFQGFGKDELKGPNTKPIAVLGDTKQ